MCVHVCMCSVHAVVLVGGDQRLAWCTGGVVCGQRRYVVHAHAVHVQAGALCRAISTPISKVPTVSMLATISGIPVHSRPECLNLKVRCSSTWWGAVWWVLSGGCGLDECGLAGCCLAGVTLQVASRDARVREAARVRSRAPGSGPGRASPRSEHRVRFNRGDVACARGQDQVHAVHRMRAQCTGRVFQGVHTCALDESSLRFGRSSTSLKSSFVSSSMRSACARPLADRQDTPSTPPATACREESRRRNEEAISTEKIHPINNRRTVRPSSRPPQHTRRDAGSFCYRKRGAAAGARPRGVVGLALSSPPHLSPQSRN